MIWLFGIMLATSLVIGFGMWWIDREDREFMNLRDEHYREYWRDGGG